MVSTRGHPKDFPEPDLSPSKTPTTPPSSRARKTRLAHAPSNLAILWLLVSLPLVTWDAGYVLLRPHSMPGGALHWPVWAPYKLYGEMDYIYGWKAFNENNGFTAAQTLLNVVETAMYVYYLYVVFTHGRQLPAHGRRAKASSGGFLGRQRYVDGRKGALALVVVHSAAVMTVSKTALYWFNEYFSGFENIGHNSVPRLLLWAVTNGAWLVLPSYIIYLTGGEIVQGLAATLGSDDKSE